MRPLQAVKRRARGRGVRLLTPNGSTQNVTHGVSADPKSSGDVGSGHASCECTYLPRTFHRELRSSPTTKVLGVCDRFKMVGVHTSGVSAEVVQDQPIRNRALQLLVHVAMCANASSVDVRPTISTLVRRSLPLPASRLNDLVFLKGAAKMVMDYIESRTAFNPSSSLVGPSRDGRLLTTAAQAQSGRVGAGVRIRVLHSDLLHRSGWAAPRVFPAPLGISLPSAILARESGCVA